VLTTRSLALSLVLLFGTACSLGHEQAVRVNAPDMPANAPDMPANAPDMQLNTRWRGSLVSPAGLPGTLPMRGSASMAPTADNRSTVVTVSLARAAPGGSASTRP
jgi:hypothetical protein